MEIRASLPKTPVGKLSKKELLAEEIAKRQAVDVHPANAPEANQSTSAAGIARDGFAPVNNSYGRGLGWRTVRHY